MEYALMVPPFDVGDVSKLTKKQADEHFIWYTSQIDFRINQLKEYVHNSSDTVVSLNKEPSSLVQIWEWFENKIEATEITEEERAEYDKLWAQGALLGDHYQFTTETLAIAMDISIYFAETFVFNNPTIHWGYYTKPKKMFSVNKPVLLGFVNDVDMDAHRIINVCMRKSMEGKNPSILVGTYNVWTQYIYNRGTVS